MSSDKRPSRTEALRFAAEYHDSLSQAMFKQETERDRTLVLISGGALTVSFAFISTFIEHTSHVVLRGLLIAAWSSWATALLFGIVGYSISIAAYKRRIAALSEARWGDVSAVPWQSRWVEPLNYAVLAAVLAGFILFGYFVIGNLKEISDERQEASHTSTEQASVGLAGIRQGAAQTRTTGNTQGKLTSARPARPAEGSR